MTERIIKHYDPPVPFEKYVPAVSRTVTRKVDTMTNYNYDTSRGPWHAMLDRMARARQAITGESYAKAFTETYCDPKNAAIRDGSKYDDLAKAFDGVYGTAHSLVKAAPAAPYDPLRKAAETAEHLGPAHARLALRNAIKAEHMSVTMAGVAKAAPADPKQDDVSPGSAHDDLNDLVMTRMKNEPKLSYQQAFTREYLHPDNRPLKQRVDAESILHAQRLAPAPAFPAYTAPGHHR